MEKRLYLGTARKREPPTRGLASEGSKPTWLLRRARTAHGDQLAMSKLSGLFLMRLE